MVNKKPTPSFSSQISGSQVRPKLLELIGLDYASKDVNFKLKSSEISGGLRIQHLEFANSIAETVQGIVCSPVSSDRELPGVVCIPGTGSNAEILANSKFYEPVQTPGRLVGWSRELAKRGFTTLAITVKGTESRRTTLKSWNTEAKLLAPYGRTQMGLIVEETLSAAKILSSLRGVDASLIGLTGMSLGGVASWYSMACAPWIATAVSICGSPSSLDTVIKIGNPDRHSSYFYIPHMLKYFDHAEIVSSCIAPRPFMMVAPTEDEDTPREGVDRLIEAVSPVYSRANYRDRFKVYQPPGRHTYTTKYFELMAEWLKKYLN